MVRIDYKSGLPIYEQLYRELLKMGTLGAFGDSGQLPSVRSIAQEVGVNPNTVQKAISLLERDGAIYTVPGKGAFFSGGEAAAKKRREDVLRRLWETAGEAAECGAALDDVVAAARKGFERREFL